jgi:WD40 repeat protein
MVKVWDTGTWQELRELAHGNNVNGVAFSADVQRLVSASQDKTLKVWDVVTGQELRTLTGHKRSL